MTIVHRWSVTLYAVGDREVTHDEVVQLADAVAAAGGIATGIGQRGYGAQIVIAAATRDQALTIGTEVFASAVEAADLPKWPVTRAEAIGEHEEAAAYDDPWDPDGGAIGDDPDVTGR